MVTGFVICAVSQTQTNPNKKSPGGQVSGTVTIRGKPAAGLVVRLRKSDSSSSDSTLKATTNEEGKYLISGISPGSYLAAPIAWGFIPSEPYSEFENGKSFVIAENESIENLDFTLIRGGVITGKVTDANGRPVMEETVNLMSADQRRPFYPGMTFQTDDRGIYRMFGIPAGRFKVSVGQADYDLTDVGKGRKPYRKTFFPNVTDPANAKMVEVVEGVELSNIDITVGQTVPMFSASGRVLDGEAGKPLTNMAIHLTRTVVLDPGSSSSVGSGAGQSDRQGEFKIENLVPGHYSLSISPSPGSDLRADPVAFDVVDQDVNDLQIKTAAGASLEGTVVLEGSQDSTATTKLARLHLRAHIEADDFGTGYGQTSRIAADGRFRIGGLKAGNARFFLSGDQEVRGFVIVRIERDGAVQPNGIQIENGEHLTGVRIILAYGNSTVRGVVKLENGTLPAGGRVSIILTKPGDPMFSDARSVGIDSTGRFIIERLFPGSYELTAYVFGPVSPQRPRSFNQVVNVAAGMVTEVLVSIDLKQTPAPTPTRP